MAAERLGHIFCPTMTTSFNRHNSESTPTLYPSVALGTIQLERQQGSIPYCRKSMGDRWFTQFKPDGEGRERLKEMREMARGYGRDPADIGVEGRVALIDSKNPDDWSRLASDRYTSLVHEAGHALGIVGSVTGTDQGRLHPQGRRVGHH